MKELRCFLVEDVRRFERKHLKDKAALTDQVDLLYGLLFPNLLMQSSMHGWERQ